ncbi:MAG TPA: ROK family transcriptional regulator, partial [Alphaproteobacteria bacterium]|nr:ROK family transcriptional regulator [Alphaproteobacteria bacterium]
RGCLERYLSLEALERRAKKIGRAGWVKEAAPLFQSAIVTIENLFDPETIVIGGLADHELLTALLDAASPLPHSVAERTGRAAPRVTLSASGPDAVLRGAAALAVSGVLSPRFGVLFAGDDERGSRDPMMSNRTEAA